MTVLSVTNLPAATHGETVRCLFAIELSGMSWVIAFNTPLSEKISRRTLIGCKWKKLLELIEDVRARVSRETGRAVEVISCYEAGYDGFWLHRQLLAHGIRNYVIDPASLQVDRRARRVKTDRIDTDRLLRSLMAYLRGEPKVWSVVRVPSVAEEDARRLHRERDRLVSERVQHVNRIKGLCALHGIYDYHPLRPQAMARLEQLATAQGGALPPYTKNGTPGDHMPPELEGLVWDKAKGFVTDPIKFDDGFEILYVEDHQKAGLATFDEVQGEVSQKLFEPRFNPALRGYLNKLRETAFLEIKPGFTDTGAIPNKDTSWVDPAQLKPETIKKEEYLAQTHRKHLLGIIPIPGTSSNATGTSSSR